MDAADVHAELESLIAIGSPPSSPRRSRRASSTGPPRGTHHQPMPQQQNQHQHHHHHHHQTHARRHPSDSSSGDASFRSLRSRGPSFASAPKAAPDAHYWQGPKQLQAAGASAGIAASATAAFGAASRLFASACSAETSRYLATGALMLLAAALLAGTLQLLLLALRTAATMLLLTATHAEAACVVLLMAAVTAALAARPWARDGPAAAALGPLVQRMGGPMRAASACVMAAGVAIMLLAAMQFQPRTIYSDGTALGIYSEDALLLGLDGSGVYGRSGSSAAAAVNIRSTDDADDWALTAFRLAAFCDPRPPGPGPAAEVRVLARRRAAVLGTGGAPLHATSTLSVLPPRPPALLAAIQVAARLACHIAVPTELRMLALPLAVRTPAIAPVALAAVGAVAAARLWLIGAFGVIAAGAALSCAGACALDRTLALGGAARLLGIWGIGSTRRRGKRVAAAAGKGVGGKNGRALPHGLPAGGGPNKQHQEQEVPRLTSSSSGGSGGAAGGRDTQSPTRAAVRAAIAAAYAARHSSSGSLTAASGAAAPQQPAVADGVAALLAQQQEGQQPQPAAAAHGAASNTAAAGSDVVAFVSLPPPSSTACCPPVPKAAVPSRGSGPPAARSRGSLLGRLAILPASGSFLLRLPPSPPLAALTLALLRLWLSAACMFAFPPPLVAAWRWGGALALRTACGALSSSARLLLYFVSPFPLFVRSFMLLPFYTTAWIVGATLWWAQVLTWPLRAQVACCRAAASGGAALGAALLRPAFSGRGSAALMLTARSPAVALCT